MRLPVYVNLWESQIYLNNAVFGGLESGSLWWCGVLHTVVIIRSSLRHVFLV